MLNVKNLVIIAGFSMSEYIEALRNIEDINDPDFCLTDIALLKFQSLTSEERDIALAESITEQQGSGFLHIFIIDRNRPLAGGGIICLLELYLKPQVITDWEEL